MVGTFSGTRSQRRRRNVSHLSKHATTHTSVHFALPFGRSHARTRGSAASHASRPPASRHVTSCRRHRCDRRGCQVSARRAPDTWREPESARRRGALPSLAPAPARGAAAALVNNRCRLPRPCRQPRDEAARGARHSACLSAARDTLPSRRRRPRCRRGADLSRRAAQERGAGPEISAPPRRSHSAEAPRRNRRGRRGKISRERSKARAEK